MYFPHLFAFFDTAECWLSAIYYNPTVFRTKLVSLLHSLNQLLLLLAFYTLSYINTVL